MVSENNFKNMYFPKECDNKILFKLNLYLNVNALPMNDVSSFYIFKKYSH